MKTVKIMWELYCLVILPLSLSLGGTTISWHIIIYIFLNKKVKNKNYNKIIKRIENSSNSYWQINTDMILTLIYFKEKD